MARRPLIVLAILYVVQGLPFGFQTAALGPYLRGEGVRLADIGFAGALAAPWMLKILWAPVVDAWGSARFGRRRSWIVPMQGLLACTCFAAAAIPEHGAITALVVAVLFMNLFAATMDVAVDGLALDLLRERGLGGGNTAQVAGYKIGMLLGGGVLAGATRWIGWNGLFVAMGAIVVAAMAITLAHEEPPSSESVHTTVRDVLRSLSRAMSGPGALTVAVVVATYKLGESLIDPMWPALLVDAGHAPEDIALWNGGIGMAASIAGSIAGGALATSIALDRALVICGVLRAIPLALQLAIAALGVPAVPELLAVIAAEHFLGGALTTAMFAFMMSRTDRTIGATHYTLLATIEVLGKSPLSLASGVIAEALGYATTFAIGLGLSLAWSLGATMAPTRARG